MWWKPAAPAKCTRPDGSMNPLTCRSVQQDGRTAASIGKQWQRFVAQRLDGPSGVPSGETKCTTEDIGSQQGSQRLSVTGRFPRQSEDREKIDEAVPARIWLTLHDEGQAWKGFDWDALERRHFC